MNLISRILITLTLLVIHVACFAQVSSHYWSHQYGAKGMLLNGSVIASVSDETAIFYNPGCMGLTEEFGVALSLITPTYSTVTNTDFLGDGTSYTEKSIDLAPGMAAIMFRPFKSKRLIMGLTTFKRFQSEVKFEDRIVSNVENDESLIFLGDFDFRRNIKESWVGVSLSYKLSKYFGIGVSQFFTFHSENMSLEFRKEILEKDDPSNLIAGWRSNFNYDFSTTGGLLTKVGMTWQPSSVKFGATFTTRTYGIAFTNANYELEERKRFVDGNLTSVSNDRNLDVNQFKTPWSIGFGVEIPVDDSVLSFSTEFFNKVGKHFIIDDLDDPLDGASSNPTLVATKVAQGNESVLNVGVGIQRKFSEKLSWFYGFRTDFSPNSLFELREGVSFLASNPDIYHISTGCRYLLKKSHFSIGVDYGFGYKSGGEQLTNISNVNLANVFEFSGEGSVETFVHQVSLYLTYDL